MKRDVGNVTLAVVLIVSVISSSIVFIFADRGIDKVESSPDMQAFIGSIASMARGKINEMSNRSAASVEAALRASIPAWVEISDSLIKGYDAVLNDVKLNLSEIRVPAGIPVPPPNIIMENDDGPLPNSIMFGNGGSTPLIPYLRTEVQMELDLIPIDGGHTGDRREEAAFTVTTADPERVMDVLLAMLEKDSSGWYSGMARDVEYMLNALVRSRVKSGIGQSFTDTYLHLLNEGDVELAVNLALLLRTYRWTGSIPSPLIDEIDSFFSEQTPEETMNPSGARKWGEAEKDNFENYISRSRGELPRRRMGDMVEIIKDFSHGDPADLFLRYLYMDRTSSGSKDPLDMESPLAEDRLLNPRQPNDVKDPFALVHHTTYPDAEGIPFKDLLGTGDALNRISPDISMHYLVSGRDLSVTGIHTYRALYTNANLSFTDSDLVAYGNSSYSNISTITRCGAIPPPTEPPSHDYRIEWNLDLEGAFHLNATVNGWSGSDPFPGYIDRKIRFSFPVRIFSGTGRLFNENFPNLRNINTGKQFYTPISTGWVITPKANATEFFESLVWQDLRGAFGPLVSLQRSVGWTLHMTEGSEKRIRIHAASMGALSALREWTHSMGEDARLLMYDLYLNNIKRPGLDPADIGPIIIDGHEISISFSPSRDRMDITSTLPEGSAVLGIWPISGGSLNVEASIHPSSDIRIELDVTGDAFALFGILDGKDTTEGSSIPRAPDNDIWSMLGEGTALYSPSFVMNISSPVLPFSGSSRVRDYSPGNASLRIIVRGDVDLDSIMKHPVLDEDPVSCLLTLVGMHEGRDVRIGLTARISTYQGIVERSMIFPYLTSAEMGKLAASGVLDSIIHILISTPALDSMYLEGTNMLIVESAPMHGVGIEPDEDMPMVSAVIHYKENGETRINYFLKRLQDVPDGGWSAVEEKAPSPLW